MFTLLRKATLIGLGLSERAKEVLDDLAKKGEENQSEEAVRVKHFFESAEKGEKEFSQKVNDLCRQVADRVKMPSRADIERLEKELADLAAQLRKWEASNRGKGEPSSY